jgi:hypothetical protein
VLPVVWPVEPVEPVEPVPWPVEPALPCPDIGDRSVSLSVAGGVLCTVFACSLSSPFPRVARVEGCWEILAENFAQFRQVGRSTQ